VVGNIRGVVEWPQEKKKKGKPAFEEGASRTRNLLNLSEKKGPESNRNKTKGSRKKKRGRSKTRNLHTNAISKKGTTRWRTSERGVSYWEKPWPHPTDEKVMRFNKKKET